MGGACSGGGRISGIWCRRVCPQVRSCLPVLILFLTPYTRQASRYERLIQACKKRFEQYINVVRLSSDVHGPVPDQHNRAIRLPLSALSIVQFTRDLHVSSLNLCRCVDQGSFLLFFCSSRFHSYIAQNSSPVNAKTRKVHHTSVTKRPLACGESRHFHFVRLRNLGHASTDLLFLDHSQFTTLPEIAMPSSRLTSV